MNLEHDLGIDQQIATMAHELKSPLALIRQMSLFIKNHSDDINLVDKYLQQITVVSERALQLTTDLSRAANFEQLDLELEPVNVMEVCKQVEFELSSFYRLHQKRLVVRPKRGQYLAVANYGLLRSILTHFCDNALHYADGSRPVEIIVNQKNNHWIQIGVRDYGPRLDRTVWRSLKKHRLLSPQKISARPQSSGLGLMISQQFAQAMAGEIDVKAHADGVTFVVSLHKSKQLSLL